jgi:hypothetical protein
MAYTLHPHPEERSRERVSKDAGWQLREAAPIYPKPLSLPTHVAADTPLTP